MPTTLQTTTLNELLPAVFPEDARIEPGNFAPNLTLVAGTVLGKITVTGKLAAYGNANNDGTQAAVAILKHDIKTDANGKVFFSSSTTASGDNQPYSNTPVYVAGVFKSADLTGWDSNAATDMGAKTWPSGYIRIP